MLPLRPLPRRLQELVPGLALALVPGLGLALGLAKGPRARARALRPPLPLLLLLPPLLALFPQPARRRLVRQVRVALPCVLCCL